MGQTFMGQTLMGQTFIGQTFMGQAFIGQTFIGQTFIGQTFMGQTLIGQVLMGQAFIGQAFMGQTLMGQTFMGQTLMGQTMKEKELIKALKTIYDFLDYVLNFLAYETDTPGTGRLANMLIDFKAILDKIKEDEKNSPNGIEYDINCPICNPNCHAGGGEEFWRTTREWHNNSHKQS